MVKFSRSFWLFLFSENLYDFGLFIFFVLYNLYLLDLGYREDFLGWVTGAMTAGHLLGTLPGAFVVQRLGLRRTMIYGSLGVSVMCAVRTLVPGRPALLIAAFAMGFISAIWTVSLVPAVAALTSDRERAQGYSFWTSSGVGIGVICGALAGALPGWLLRWGVAANAVRAKQVALLFGATVAFLSPSLLVRLPLDKPQRTEPRTFPRSSFVVRYLAAYVVWNFAIGIFNPFFSAYFSLQLHMPLERIGVVYSAAQLATVGALLAAPAVLRALGRVAGIAAMQLGMAAMLLLLATKPSAIAAGAVYAAYMSFQVMTEPGTFTLLMEGVKEGERAGASALNFLAMSGPQAASAAIAGVAVTRFGYQPVLATAAAIAAVAAFLFWRLLGTEIQSAGRT